MTAVHKLRQRIDCAASRLQQFLSHLGESLRNWDMWDYDATKGLLSIAGPFDTDIAALAAALNRAGISYNGTFVQGRLCEITIHILRLIADQPVITFEPCRPRMCVNCGALFTVNELYPRCPDCARSFAPAKDADDGFWHEEA